MGKGVSLLAELRAADAVHGSTKDERMVGTQERYAALNELYDAINRINATGR